MRVFAMKAVVTKALVLAAVLMASACANKEKLMDVAKNNAKSVYENCVKEYKQTMSDSDARKACTDKLKASYKAATAE